MKISLKKLILFLLKINFLKLFFDRFANWYLKNLQDTSNAYEMINIRVIGTPKGKYFAQKYSNFISTKIDLRSKNFLDIGCGDLNLLSELNKVNPPNKYYAFDINLGNILFGINFCQKNQMDISNLIYETGGSFEFEKIKDNEIDFAFSHSLCCHLTVNTLSILLKNLKPKMRKGSFYLTSFIFDDRDEKYFNEKIKIGWDLVDSFNKKKYKINSYFQKDPYHYLPSTIKKIASDSGWDFIRIEEHGHELQKVAILSPKF
jgi:SAM-dependent methyltransferase